MPQVHNKSISLAQDSSAFNKKSRYAASLAFSDNSKKRVNVLNKLERRLSNVKLKYFERHSGIAINKIEHAKERMIQNLKKRLAYKVVLKNHSICNAKDYNKALDGKYTFMAFSNEVKSMMDFMRPEHMRERKAKALVDENRRRYDNILRKNRKETDRIFPVAKWEAVDFSKFGQKDEDEEEKEVKVVETHMERKHRMSIATLRRRIIAVDSPKPNSPLKLPTIYSPTKSPGLTKQASSGSIFAGKRQGITMSMMKKQTSFIDNQGRITVTPRDDVKQVLDANDTDQTLADKLDKQVNISDSKTKDNKHSNEKPPPNAPSEAVNRENVSGKESANNSFLPEIKQPSASSVSTNRKQSLGSNKGVKLPKLKMSNSSRRQSSLL